MYAESVRELDCDSASIKFVESEVILVNTGAGFENNAVG